MSWRPVSYGDVDAVKALYADGLSVRRIALKLGVSYDAVRNLVREMELDTSGKDAEAYRKRLSAHNMKRRAEHAARLLDVADVAFERMHEPTIVFSFGGKENVYEEHEFAEPPANVFKQLTDTVSVAHSAHMKIDAYDKTTTDSLPAVDAWLDAITGVEERGEQYVEHTDQSGDVVEQSE
jgi:hypothetical protein